MPIARSCDRSEYDKLVAERLLICVWINGSRSNYIDIFAIATRLTNFPDVSASEIGKKTVARRAGQGGACQSEYVNLSGNEMDWCPSHCQGHGFFFCARVIARVTMALDIASSCGTSKPARNLLSVPT